MGSIDLVLVDIKDAEGKIYIDDNVVEDIKRIGEPDLFVVPKQMSKKEILRELERIEAIPTWANACYVGDIKIGGGGQEYHYIYQFCEI